MKKSIVFRHVFLLIMVLLIPLLEACKKDKVMEPVLKCHVVPKEGADDDIVGKWKLVRAKKVFPLTKEEDYSCENIIYHFQEDGELIISGNTKGRTGYEAGKYSFVFKNEKLYDELEEKYNLKLGFTDIACDIKEDRMILNNSFLDGDILHFVRIE